jgi:hypothetical protein
MRYKAGKDTDGWYGIDNGPPPTREQVMSTLVGDDDNEHLTRKTFEYKHFKCIPEKHFGFSIVSHDGEKLAELAGVYTDKPAAKNAIDGFLKSKTIESSGKRGK